ncbi:acyl-CoA carboxylase subunit epsilon [Actinosynnema sp. NPDC004786]
MTAANRPAVAGGAEDRRAAVTDGGLRGATAGGGELSGVAGGAGDRRFAVTGEVDPPPGPLLRVEKGEPDAVELAALTAVLQRRVTAVAAAEEAPRRSARWRRPERVAGFAGARTWRN